MRYYSSTLDHRGHKMEAQKGTEGNKWTRDDIENGLLTKSIESSKLEREQKEEKFNSGLGEDGAISRIAESGTMQEKAKAFDYMAKQKPSENPDTTANFGGNESERIAAIQSMMNKNQNK